ncbi:hypothetical protein G9A89_006142 [Geosiphon pyriformis]|nr:hypothetical protein G9A89_006142 [Geosiphon pyriformis]
MPELDISTLIEAFNVHVGFEVLQKRAQNLRKREMGIAEGEPTEVPCPWCKTEVPKDAIKCKFCCSFLNEKPPVKPTATVPTVDEGQNNPPAISETLIDATVSLSIVIIKKVVKDSGSGSGFKPVLLRKKRKSVILEKGVGSKEMPTEVPSGHSCGSKTGNTTKSESINIKKKCLVEETSFNYGKRGTIIDGNHDYMPKRPSVKTTKVLSKSLDKINFSEHNDDDDILLDISLKLPSFLKDLVTVFVRKSFALNIGLNKVVRKFSQEKLMVVRKLFSKVNGFGEASTSSKFSEIICASFIFKSSLVQKIPVGTLAETVHAVLSEFGSVVSIKMQLVGLWQKAVVEFAKSD